MLSPNSLLQAIRRAQPTTWLLLSGFLSLCCAGTLIVVTSAAMLRSSSERMTAEMLEANMRVAWHVFDGLGGDLRADGGHMTVGGIMLDDSSDFFRSMSGLTKGVTAIFMGDREIGSTAQSAFAREAVRGRLTDPAATDAVFRRHQRFRGQATVLGEEYYAALDPILSHDDTVIGAMFVGIPKAEVEAAVSRGSAMIVDIPLLAILLAGSLFLMGGRRLAGLIANRQRAADEARTRLDTALANMANGLALWDAGHRLVVFNRQFIDVLRMPEALIHTGMTFRELCAVRHRCGDFGTIDFETAFAERMRLVSGQKACSFLLPCEGGRTVAVSHRQLTDAGFVTTYEDVTERHASEAKINFMAHYDALTGLGNRVLFDQHVRRALGQTAGQVGPARRGAVMTLDLDRFKAVNDTLGHAAGDRLLVAVGKRLAGLLRSTDTLARLGGDEFAVIVALGESGADICDLLAERIVRQLAEPFEIGGDIAVVGVSIGMALFPDHGETPNELLRCADIAMYHAKEAGRGQYSLFDPAMDAALQQRRALEHDLRDAIATEGLALHYQPLVCCATGRVEGYEALLRWNHPRLGPISPTVFVPLAEETNLILPLGLWVLQTACAAAAAWTAPAQLAVNLSPAQFRQPDLTATILDTLARTGLSPLRLEVEITEGVLIDDPARAMAMLSDLRAAGVRVSLDDFGTGYSSLSYLRQFPLDKIKIDKSFIDNMTEDPQAASIVEALVGLAHTLDLKVTAEGVETARQLCALQAQRCDQVQGYLVGRPAVGVIGAMVVLPSTEPGDSPGSGGRPDPAFGASAPGAAGLVVTKALAFEAAG